MQNFPVELTGAINPVTTPYFDSRHLEAFPIGEVSFVSQKVYNGRKPANGVDEIVTLRENQLSKMRKEVLPLIKQGKFKLFKPGPTQQKKEQKKDNNSDDSSNSCVIL